MCAVSTQTTLVADDRDTGTRRLGDHTALQNSGGRWRSGWVVCAGIWKSKSDSTISLTPGPLGPSPSPPHRFEH
jgi:hypothetical protein